MNSDGLNWKSKYKAIKEKYEQLITLRKKAVEEDCEDLQAKIDEHQRVHKQIIDEIQNHNAALMESYKKSQKLRDKISQLRNSNSNLVKALSTKDSVLNTFLRYEQFEIHFIGPKVYEIGIQTSKEKLFSFQIQQFGNSSFSYLPLNIPNDIKEEQFKRKMQVSDLHNLCKTIISLTGYPSSN